MMKHVKHFTALAIAAALLTGCSSGNVASEAEVESTRIVIADARTTHHLNLYVAQELGLFEKYNLDVEIITVDDNAAARDLAVSGGADVFWSCPTVAIAAIANGAPLSTIAQVKKPCTSVLVVPQDSDIESLADLHGKEIAGISPTCEAVISLNVAARNAGAEFNLQRLAGGPSITALEGGSVDAAILEEPHTSIAELAGYKVLFREVSESIPCRTINVSDRFLASNTEALTDFVKAVEEANEVILSDPTADNIVKIAVDYTGAPEDAIRHGNHRLLFGTDLDVEGLIALGDELLANGDIKENPNDRMFAEEFKGITW